MAELGLAFAAGLVSFLSPCVLPLIPVYLAYLTGSSFDELREKTPRRLVLIHAGFFTVGFSAAFIAMGATASALGGLLDANRIWLERLGGIVLALLGLWMLGAFNAAFLYKDVRVRLEKKPIGPAGSILVGAAFAAGWTPCVGPVLSSILILAGRGGSVGWGVLLLGVYSLGFALPLLGCALALERSLKILDRLKPKLPLLEKCVGGVLVALGVVLATGLFERFATWPLSYFAAWARLFEF